MKYLFLLVCSILVFSPRASYALTFYDLNDKSSRIEYSQDIIKRVAKQEKASPDLLLAIAKHESGFDYWAVNTHNGDGSMDFGLFQYNNFYFQDVIDKCYGDPECETRWAIKKIRAGGLGIWQWTKKANLK